MAAGLQQSIQEIVSKLECIDNKLFSVNDKYYKKFKKFDLPVKYIFDYNKKELIETDNFNLDNHYLITKYSYYLYRLCDLENNNTDEFRNNTFNVFDIYKVINNMKLQTKYNFGGLIIKNQLIYYIDNYCNIYIEELKLYIKINYKQQSIIPHYINNRLFSAIKNSIHWDIFLNQNNIIEKQYIINMLYYMINFIQLREINESDINIFAFMKDDINIKKYSNFDLTNIDFVYDNITFLLNFIDYFNKLRIFNDF
jgi:hypothetical protein